MLVVSGSHLLEFGLTCLRKKRKKKKEESKSRQTRANPCTVIPLCLHTEFPEQRISAVNLL